LCIFVPENIKICVAIYKKASASGGLRPQTPYRGFAPGPHWGLPSPRPNGIPPRIVAFSPRRRMLE